MNINAIQSILFDYYGLRSSSIQSLPGEVDHNYKIVSEDDRIYTLKISRDSSQPQWMDLQASILTYLAERDMSFQIPEIIPNLQGAPYFPVTSLGGTEQFVRLQKWVPGIVWAKTIPHTEALLFELGQVAGQLSSSLQNFDHPGAHKTFDWDNHQLLHYESWDKYLTSPEEKKVVQHFFSQFRKDLGIIEALRKQVCYNDLNDFNILTQTVESKIKISGIIDFGDTVYTETINELAIACAYACMHHANPLEAAFHLVQGYHLINQLHDEELQVLHTLIGARLVISVCRSAYNKIQEPDNEYLAISEKPAWKLLFEWKTVHPRFAYYRFREACGLEPCPQYSIFNKWLSNTTTQPVPPIDVTNKKLAWLDLSIGSTDLGHFENFNAYAKFEKTIQNLLEEKSADIGLGGYEEHRLFYTTDAYRRTGLAGHEWRTAHIGLDIWAPSGTPVLAPWSSRIFAKANHQNLRDYGGLLILEHTVQELTFYSLYGHLAWKSISQWQKGDKIKQGQPIATLGDQLENGEWPPHLHFQIILDLFNYTNDYPGVAYPREIKTWKSICPFVDFYSNPSDQKVVTSHDLMTLRKKMLGPNLSVSYAPPIHMVRGQGQYLYDVRGQRYLDTVNNVAHIGHEHPRVVEAGQKQMAILNTNTRYLHKNILDYAQALLAQFPEPLEVCYFVNSGSEANELALRMARTYRQRKDMIAIEVGYHGNTGNTIDVSSYKFDQPGGAGKPEFTHLIPMPDIFRGEHQDLKTAGKIYAGYVNKIIENLHGIDRPVAGFIAESILSCGGQIELPKGYLSAIYEKVRGAGGLCIADEVQVGFGRVGSHFWGFELQGVIPDIVTLGKPIGNGHPLGAVVCTRAVADAFNNGMEYFNTYGGNPVSCAIGLEVLRVIEEEGLQNHAHSMGKYIKNKLQEIQSYSPLIGDVRGQGLFLGFELVKNLNTRQPAPQEATYIANRMRTLGYLMSTDGPDHNVIKIKPPMCITIPDVDDWMEKLQRTLEEAECIFGYM